MTKLSFQDALLHGYKQYSFRSAIYDLTEANTQKHFKLQQPENEKDFLYLVDPDIDYSMTISPENVIYNATEDLHSGTYNIVTASDAFKLWKKQTEEFLTKIKETTMTFNVTNIILTD